MSDRFDPAKDAINRDRHGLPLLFGDAVMADPDHLVVPTIRPEDGEERFKAVGLVYGKLYAAVFVWRGDLPRFISVRRSNPGEEKRYRDPR
ncbi:BrnT family toxin [Palleronia rufa]|uniref:BrnT family toxin n=1 Tax=Palleronia rufa TaxID=1530186 RepID=UPI000568E9AA|nr:BrnT family toxin [Palleronia rufa]